MIHCKATVACIIFNFIKINVFVNFLSGTLNWSQQNQNWSLEIGHLVNLMLNKLVTRNSSNKIKTKVKKCTYIIFVTTI